ncbi:unnamed protein product [Rotaria magnacalcarata]|uniref:Short-chain dehydrogenase/reductase 3 n=1 Tax=Rotaria magnacalcarata TaxID=392030 RepID=A0A816NWN2_9BILA|nr:unnamed protein product [Rotaria magnacalcarata]CAF1610049.1 unnamed protein product [Rotaria magnacalcarata]CAF2040921.1 unnamed protein product [Rotaria magnacalcarata]CAF2223808.1 unnamed protein product [Rotaria magnacalcarata]CAF3908422.1 unnamed protein product [Rotaria magnacalcarata]
MADLFGCLRLLTNIILYPFAVIFLIFYRCIQWLGFQPTVHDFNNNIVLVSGSANGLGREIAVAFAKAGASLALLDIDDDGNRETQQLCLSALHNKHSSSRVRIYHVDVTRSTEVYACAEKIRHDLGQVTVLVANAGFVSGRSLVNESDVDIERTFNVNSLSPIWLVKAFLPYMLDADRGHVVLVSSVLGIHASHGPITYVASKHASLGFSRALRLDIHATKPNTRVSVHCICPYLMRTKMFNPLVSRVSFKLLFPIVSPSYAAEQILDAITWNRKEIILPYHLKYIGLINDMFLPQWLSEWLLFKISGRRPLDTFQKEQDESFRDKKRKNIFVTH